ncbi:MAG TPA: MaoC family dehydratase [Actinomycetota bacterium]
MTTYLEDIAEGLEIVTESHEVSAAEISSFCMVSGDHNPLHTDDVFARSVGYRERIAHGLLIVSITSGLRSLSDDWALNAYLEETRRFRTPVYPGDEIHMVSIVTAVRRSNSDPTRGIVTLTIEVRNQDGDVVQDGTDIVMVGAREDA